VSLLCHGLQAKEREERRWQRDDEDKAAQEQQWSKDREKGLKVTIEKRKRGLQPMRWTIRSPPPPVSQSRHPLPSAAYLLG
jgi:hypothetical protein